MPKRQGVTANGTVTVAWDRDVRGSGTRAIMGAFAYATNVALMGAPDAQGRLACPLAVDAQGEPVRFLPADGEVDRTTGERDGYAPGFVCLVSVQGNQGRAVWQGDAHQGSDLPGAARYAADVLAVAATLPLMRERDARAFVASWEREDYGTAVARGRYGTP